MQLKKFLLAKFYTFMKYSFCRWKYLKYMDIYRYILLYKF